MSAPALLIFLVFALPASAIDIRSYRIPDLLVFPGFAAVFIFLLSSRAGVLPDRVAASLLSGLFFFIIRRFTGALGLGDVKFAMLIGLCCGLPWVCVAFLAASLMGIGFILILRRGKQERIPLPFAPFLTAGVIAAFVFSRFLRFF
ncbi:MAG: A24 family peptidase [Treponema sp.]|jgi:prepilin signal peptidase PulO-like enzyme (type II secretory pathway)|nr:A24 family peptidase [Treponema sp.]